MTEKKLEDFGIKDRLDLLFDIIGRFDFYVNSANTKGSLIIAWNGVIVGAVLLKYSEILDAFAKSPQFRAPVTFVLIVISALAVLSTLIVFKVVFPFLERDSKPKSEVKTLSAESAFFFSSVAKLSSNAYFKIASTTSGEKLLEDLSDQVVTVARGLDSKMAYLRISIWFIVVELILVLLLIIFRIYSNV